VVAPQTKVYAFFDLSATGGDYLTLDSPDGKGQLGDAAAILAGDVATEITDYVTSVSVDRGRDSQLFADMPAGRWRVVLRNVDRRFDPVYALSPYAGNIVPGKRVQIVCQDVVVADGNIQDWDYDYDVGGYSVAYLACADALSHLAGAQFSEWTATLGETAGTRINAALDRTEVSYTLNRDIDVGVSTLTNDTVAWSTNVLAYVNNVSNSDLGWLYASRNGALTFRDRHSNLNATAALAFADTGDEIPYNGITVSYGTEKLYNRVGIQREGGVAQTVENAASQATYRVRSLSQTGLLLEDDTQAAEMATYLLGIYSSPELRVSSMTIQLAGLTEFQQRQVLSLDITSLVSVTFTPNKIGSAIQRTCIVEGVAHDITPVSHVVTLSLGDTDRRSTMRLDDDVFGKLDTNVLTF
jgi:hypothetical protein